jgi:small subunit ribosomal protein S3Ae
LQKASQSSLSQFVSDLINRKFELDIVKHCCKFYPLDKQNILIRKVKMLKKPKFDAGKMQELYQGQKGEVIKAEDVDEEDDSKNILSKETK